MSGYLDRLNLRPMEKRLVVVVAAVLFLVLNAVFVFPHFSDWGQVKFRMSKAETKLRLYKSTTNQIPVYQKMITAVQSEENSTVPPEEQSVQFQRIILDHQIQSGVTIKGTSKQSTRTNQFFLEVMETVSVQAKEEQLVDFLYNLGSGSSLIRVRDLTLRPDAPRQNLEANIKLVASYQKKPTTRSPQSAGAASSAPPSDAEAASTAAAKKTSEKRAAPRKVGPDLAPTPVSKKP